MAQEVARYSSGTLVAGPEHRAPSQDLFTRDDPAAIYLAQPQWLTVLRSDIGGFAPNLVVGEIVDFYSLFRQAA